MTIGENIKNYRKKRGFTQKELAEKSNLSRSYLADLERNRYNPSLDSLQLIAHSLDVNVSDLLGEKSNDNKMEELAYKDITSVEDALEIIKFQDGLMLNGKILTDEDKILLANALQLGMKYVLDKKKKEKEND